MKQKIPESGVLRACLDLLAAERIWHERRNNVPVMVPAGNGRMRPVKVAQNGTADIMATPATYCGSRCCLPPKDEDELCLWEQRHCMRLNTAMLWIECKSDSG